MIELRHLRYFIAVAEALNFRRAAERVHVDQTPLSRAIRDLEEKLGVQLFARSSRKLELTPAGVRFLEDAREVLIRIEGARRTARTIDGRSRLPLRIGVADDIAQFQLTECLIRWRDVAAEVPLDISEMRAAELLEALQREDVDVGFSFGLPATDNIAQLPAWSYGLVALLPSGHDLAWRSAVHMTELLESPLLCFGADRQPGLLKQIRTIAQRYATATRSAGEVNSMSGYVTRVAAGMGVGLVDAGSAQTMIRHDLAVKPLVEPERITTFVVHKLRHRGLQGDLKRFVEHVLAM